VNIQDRIAKLEKELAELKEDCLDESWSPREGEICEFSDDKDIWYTERFVVKTDDTSYPYVSYSSEAYKYCRPLNDPMVIQLIPHVPGDPMPCDGDAKVLVRLKMGALEIDHAKNWDWSLSRYRELERSNIVAWKRLDEN